MQYEYLKRKDLKKEAGYPEAKYPEYCSECGSKNEGNNHRCSNCDIEFETLPIDIGKEPSE